MAANSMLKIPLDHLPLRPSTLERCKLSGFVTAADIESAKTTGGWATLAAELGVSTIQEAHALYREIQECGGKENNSSSAAVVVTPAATNVAAALRTTTNGAFGAQNIITFSREIDKLLRGGIPLGEVTDISGIPGAGKTALAMQIAVNAALPSIYGGVGGGAIFIDTEGSFAPERCYAMAYALIAHVQESDQRRNTPTDDGTTWDATPQDILNNIHVFRAHTVMELLTVLQALPEFLTQFPDIRLIVVDSIAFPFRAEAAERERNRQLVAAAAQLAQLATRYRVAVATTNHMTTNADGLVVPALGASWAHAVTNRLVLDEEGTASMVNHYTQRRTCELAKSARMPPGKVSFLITKAGIRGADTIATNTENRKRQRSDHRLDDDVN